MRGIRIFVPAVTFALAIASLKSITAQQIGARPNAEGSSQIIDESAEQTKRANERNQAVVNELRSLRTEISSIRDQTERIEREKATQHSPGGPPLWSNWFLVGVAGATAFF